MPSVATRSKPLDAKVEEPSHESRFMSVKTLAELWDCSRTTVSRLLDAAGVPAFYFGHGRSGSKRYKKDDIDRYLQKLDTA
jgi:Helix-turn-helix domain